MDTESPAPPAEPHTQTLAASFKHAVELWKGGETATSSVLWEAVAGIASHGRPAYDDALRILKSPDPAHRVVAADVLAMVAVENPGAGQSIARAMMRLLEQENDVMVLWSALVALGPTGASVALPTLIAWASDQDPDLRSQAVQSLATVMADSGETDEGLDVVIAAMEDPDREVGYWATLSLASTLNSDNEKVRMALSKRLFDLDDGIRNEAILGLAKRKDGRMRTTLEQALLAPEPPARIFDAVQALGDVRLLPILQRANTSAISEERRQEIVQACQPPEADH